MCHTWEHNGEKIKQLAALFIVYCPGVGPNNKKAYPSYQGCPDVQRALNILQCCSKNLRNFKKKVVIFVMDSRNTGVHNGGANINTAQIECRITGNVGVRTSKRIVYDLYASPTSTTLKTVLL